MMPPVFGWPIWSDPGLAYVPQLSGGSWLAALPRTNVQDRRRHSVARSTDATLASTQMQFDLGAERSVRALFVGSHNLSTAALIRWRGGDSVGDFSMPDYDSGWFGAWPSGISVEDANRINVDAFRAPPGGADARYWLLEVNDTTNAAGFIDIGRVAIAGGLPLDGVGISVGARLGVQTASQRVETDGGSYLYNVRRSRRTQTVAIQGIAEAPALVGVYRSQLQAGIDRQVVWIPEPEDTTNGWLRNMLCTVQEPGPLEWTMYNALDWQLTLTEEL